MVDRDHKISFEKKNEYALRHIDQRTVSEDKPRLYRYNVDQVKELVNLEGADEVIIERGIDESGKEVVVISVIDQDRNPISHALELGVPCPPECG